MNDAALVIAGQLEAATAPCITCSFQAEDVVVLHMLRSIAPDIPVPHHLRVSVHRVPRRLRRRRQ